MGPPACPSGRYWCVNSCGEGDGGGLIPGGGNCGGA